MKLALIILILGLNQSCIKDEAELDTASIGSGGTTGGTTTLLDDPLAQYAWHLKNTGQDTFSSTAPTSGEDIKLEEAQALGYTGKNIKIAISDSGVQYNHPDLAANQITGGHRNYGLDLPDQWRNADPTPGIQVEDAHGTAVAGIAAAVGWNGIGSRGVAPDAKYGAFLFIYDYPVTVTAASFLARLLDQMDGDFDIFNYSYGSTGCSFESEEPAEQAILEVGATTLRDGKGALYVQSAGNNYSFSAPCAARFDNTNRDPSLASTFKIVVGAVTASGVRSSYSTPGSSIWLSAPGGEDGAILPAILTTDISTCNFGLSTRLGGTTNFNSGNHAFNLECSFTSIMNGTSAAAPIVSGVVALLLEANPNLTWRDVKHILAATADRIDYSALSNTLTHQEILNNLPSPYVFDYKWVTNAAGYHYSNWYGFGRINALAAVQMAKTYNLSLLRTFEKTANPNNDEWYYSSGALTTAITDFGPLGVSSGILVRHNLEIESVQIRMTTTHVRPGQLAVHLVSPSGTESRVLNLNTLLDNNSLDADFLMITNAFYGENSYGTWTLKVFDGTGGDVGDLTGWKININGRRRSVAGAIPNMPGVPTMDAFFGSASTSPAVTFAASTTFGVIRYEVSVGSTPGASDQSEWQSIGNATSFQLQGMFLNNFQTYYMNIRAIDVFENSSFVRTKAWGVNF